MKKSKWLFSGILVLLFLWAGLYFRGSRVPSVFPRGQLGPRTGHRAEVKKVVPTGHSTLKPKSPVRGTRKQLISKDSFSSKALVIRVQDENGRPLSGIPVGLFEKALYEKHFRQVSIVRKAITGKSGEASFEGAFSLFLKDRELKYCLWAGLAIPLGVSEFKPILLEKATFRKPRPQVVLRRPALGYVRVRVPSETQAHGGGKFRVSLVPDFFRVQSFSREELLAKLSWWEFSPEGGQYLFPVGLGLRLEVWCLYPGLSPWLDQKIDGPRVANQVVDVFLERGNLDWCRAQALDWKGRTLGGKTIMVFFPWRWDPFVIDETVRSSIWMKVKSDKKGTFSFPLPVRFKQTSMERGEKKNSLMVLFQCLPGKEFDKVGPPLRAVAEIPISRPGGLFLLGKVRFHPPLHRIQVHLVDEKNRPVPEARVDLSVFGWKSAYGAGRRKKTDQDGIGRFLVYSRVGGYRISASKKGYLGVQTKPRPLETVTRVLKLQGVGKIAFRVLLGRDVLENRIPFKVLLFAERILPRKGFKKIGYVDKEGTGAISPLLPGIFKVDVKVMGVRGPILALDGIRVERGKTTKDPRLNPLDLRPYLHGVTLEVIPPGNWKGRVYFPDFYSRQVGPNRYQFLLPQAFPARILLKGPGIRDQVVEVSGPSAKVTLRKGIPLELSLSGRVPTLPEGVRIGAREVPTCLPMNYMATGFYQDFSRYYSEWMTTGGIGEFDEKGECRILVGGPGKRRIDLYLVSRKGGRVHKCRTLQKETLQIPPEPLSPLSHTVKLDPKVFSRALMSFQGK